MFNTRIKLNLPSTITRSSLAQRNWQKFMSNKLALVGLTIVIVFVSGSILAPLISAYDPSYIDPTIRYLPPSTEHWLGTDSLGRDVMTRLLYGGGMSIFVGVTSAICASAIGVVLGCIAGYLGGKKDSAILYVSEIFMAFPQILIVIIMVGFTGRGILNLILIFSFTGWMGCMRIVRGKVLSLKEESFVESCRANGIGSMSIMFRHLLPNTFGPIIVNVTLGTAIYILQEAALSFLGIGLDPSIPTWGNMINAARSLEIIQNYPNLWLAPGFAICLLVLGINFFGDGLRDVFDPKQ